MSPSRSERLRAVTGLVMGALVTQAGVADAQPNPSKTEPLVVALEYSAPSACPNEAQFRERAERSSARLRWGAKAEGSRAYHVVIDSQRDGFRGRLYEAGKATPRALEVPVCEELVDALSLMLALSADATLAGAPTADASDASEAAPAATVEAPSAPAPSPPSAPIAQAKPARRRTEPRDVPRPDRLGSSAIALLNAAPDTLFGLAFGYERALRRLVSLRLEARAAMGRTRADENYGGVAPAICLRLERPYGELLGCGGLLLGYLDVKGVEYSGGKQSSYCLAPLLGLKLRGFIGGTLTLELGAELQHAFITRSYAVKRDDSTFETPVVSQAVQLGAGARF